MQRMDCLYKNQFTNSVAKVFGVSAVGKMLTPLSFSEGRLLNGTIEMLSVSIEKIIPFSKNKSICKEVSIVIRIGASIALLATIHFSTRILSSYSLKFYRCAFR